MGLSGSERIRSEGIGLRGDINTRENLNTSIYLLKKVLFFPEQKSNVADRKHKIIQINLMFDSYNPPAFLWFVLS